MKETTNKSLIKGIPKSKQGERSENDFNYHQSKVPKAGKQSFLSSGFQDEFREITQKHKIESKGYGASPENSLMKARALLDSESNNRGKSRPVLQNNGMGILGISNEKPHKVSDSSTIVSVTFLKFNLNNFHPLLCI